MKHRTTQSALLAAGAAAGMAALAWVGRRRQTGAAARKAALDPNTLLERPELPIGRSADPAIDEELRFTGGRDETSGALFSEPERDRPVSEDISLEQIWDAAPRSNDDAPTEGYDAVAPEDLGSVWLERATETAREDRLYTGDPADPVVLDDLMVSEATRASALPWDAEDAETEGEDDAATRGEEQDPNDVQEDDLDIDEKRDSRP